MPGRRLVVTGAPRSGTTWVAHALLEAGVPCSHERVATEFGQRPWATWAADSSWCWPAYYDALDLATPVVIVYRSPWPTVTSLVRCGWVADDPTNAAVDVFLRHHAPAVYDAADETGRAASWWATWYGWALDWPGRRLVFDLADLTDDPTVLRALAGAAGSPISEPHAARIQAALPPLNAAKSRRSDALPVDPGDLDPDLAALVAERWEQLTALADATWADLVETLA